MLMHLRLDVLGNHLLPQLIRTRPRVVYLTVNALNPRPSQALLKSLQVNQQRGEDTGIKEKDLFAHLLLACDGNVDCE